MEQEVKLSKINKKLKWIRKMNSLQTTFDIHIPVFFFFFFFQVKIISTFQEHSDKNYSLT